ncbi:SDR family oxidoreductase [Flavisphingomonas formosensis]|uniref:SDR family oxidoreductase n=1 Tax=Flavisphingomonas formosensis TaxID=861534 RepID=UPI0012F7176F|nr:SDR family oxidoreductase [Sphingomonas formosensis]
MQSDGTIDKRRNANLSDAHTAQSSLSGRRIIVTGGTTGIGRAISVLLASYGAKLFVCGRTPEHLADALARIREVGEGDGISVDLAKDAERHRFFEAADDYLGGIDVAIINAAIPADDLAGTDEEELHYQIATDFTAYIASAHAAVRRMGAGSDLVLIGSMSAVSRSAGSSVYVAAKSGIEGFSQALRKEVGEQDIKVGLVEPGFTGADFQYPEFPPDKQRELIRQHKMLRAEDIAVAVHFMLTQPRRSAISLIRVETRLPHP